MASQKEIAKKAGVSVSTVSRVLGGMGEKAASPKIARKIWEAARELGYTPNPAARALRLGETDKKDPPRLVTLLACVLALLTLPPPASHWGPKTATEKPVPS